MFPKSCRTHDESINLRILRYQHMKKISFTVLCLVFMSSCVKDRVCSCDVTSAAGTVTEEVIYRGKKKAAKDACELRSGTENGVTTNCTLK